MNYTRSGKLMGLAKGQFYLRRSVNNHKLKFMNSYILSMQNNKFISLINSVVCTCGMNINKIYELICLCKINL